MVLVAIPTDENIVEMKIRDMIDCSILWIFIVAEDVLFDSNKDILEDGLVNPMIMTAAEFIKK